MELLRFCVSLAKNFPRYFFIAFLVFFILAVLSVPVHAVPADSLPADKVPATACKLWAAGGLGFQAPRVCGPIEAANAVADVIKSKGWCLSEGLGPNSSKDSSIGRLSTGACTFVFTETGDDSGYVTASMTLTNHLSGKISVRNTQQVVYSDGISGYQCPPSGNSDYLTMVVDDEGFSWCLKPGFPENLCPSRAESGQKGVDSNAWLYVEDGIRNCNSGCEVKPAPSDNAIYWCQRTNSGYLACKYPQGSVFTGVQCSGGGVAEPINPPSETPSESPLPSDDYDPETDEPVEDSTTDGADDCEMTYNAATGQLSCQASSTKQGSGSYCGEINGVYQCVNGPASSVTDISKTGTINSDGSITTNTTTTKTECVGAHCTSSTTTSSSTSGGGGGSSSGGGGGGGSNGGADMPGDYGGDYSASWWESDYPEGLAGVWSDFSSEILQTEMFSFLDQFKIEPSGTAPDFSLCFNLGALGNFGCSSFDIPPYVWAFIRICILVTAAFTCRRLIFGG